MFKTITLGQSGVYTDSEGKAKAATVIGTRASIRPHTEVARPEEGRVNLLILVPNGKTYVRENVKTQDDATKGSLRQTFVTAKAFAKRPVPVEPEVQDVDEDPEYDGFEENDDEN